MRRVAITSRGPLTIACSRRRNELVSAAADASSVGRTPRECYAPIQANRVRTVARFVRLTAYWVVLASLLVFFPLLQAWDAMPEPLDQPRFLFVLG